MSINIIETILRWAGGLLAYTSLAIILYGIWRGYHRPAGRSSGATASWVRSPWFILITTILFITLALLGWRRLPLSLSVTSRIYLLVIGSLLYFPGMLFVLWGRLALGRNYFVSTGFGAQLFTGHQLVTSGPFAIVRHPMYCGIILSAMGSLLIYQTWTALAFACFAPFLLVRTYREELALAEEFGKQWQVYCKRVPAFFPRFIRKRE